jgi:hypothetical protein
MAAFQGVASVSEAALVAATQRTVLQIVAAANHRVKLLGWGVFFDGVSAADEPIEVVVQRQSTAGTSSANTPKKVDDSLAETLLTTARDGFSSTEPTSGDILWAGEIHPQSGYEKLFPLGQELIVGGGDRLAIRCTIPTGGTAVNARAFMHFEE